MYTGIQNQKHSVFVKQITSINFKTAKYQKQRLQKNKTILKTILSQTK